MVLSEICAIFVLGNKFNKHLVIMAKNSKTSSVNFLSFGNYNIIYLRFEQLFVLSSREGCGFARVCSMLPETFNSCFLLGDSDKIAACIDVVVSSKSDVVRSVELLSL